MQTISREEVKGLPSFRHKRKLQDSAKYVTLIENSMGKFVNSSHTTLKSAERASNENACPLFKIVDDK